MDSQQPHFTTLTGRQTKHEHCLDVEAAFERDSPQNHIHDCRVDIIDRKHRLIARFRVYWKRYRHLRGNKWASRKPNGELRSLNTEYLRGDAVVSKVGASNHITNFGAGRKDRILSDWVIRK